MAELSHCEAIATQIRSTAYFGMENGQLCFFWVFFGGRAQKITQIELGYISYFNKNFLSCSRERQFSRHVWRSWKGKTETRQDYLSNRVISEKGSIVEKHMRDRWVVWGGMRCERSAGKQVCDHWDNQGWNKGVWQQLSDIWSREGYKLYVEKLQVGVKRGHGRHGDETHDQKKDWENDVRYY